MFKALFGEVRIGRLLRLPYLGYSVLLVPSNMLARGVGTPIQPGLKGITGSSNHKEERKMKTGKLRNAVLMCSALMLLGAGSSAIAATSAKGMKNCENALIEKGDKNRGQTTVSREIERRALLHVKS